MLDAGRSCVLYRAVGTDRRPQPDRQVREDGAVTTETDPSTAVDAASHESRAAAAKPTAREINAQIVYTAFAVYSRVSDLDAPADKATAELVDLVAELSERGVTLRGFYDVSALRADADLMVWWHAPTAEALQAAARSLRRTAVGRTLSPSWSAMGLHRPAEFNKGHVPAFLAGAAAKNWATVYPFVRSYEWYLLPDAERRGMLVEHGMMGREYNQVLSNTVAAFALGDWEWILALEATELHDIVDLMRHLRSSQARLHVREEIPFFTGRLIDVDGVIEVVR
jgi:peroxiredoxin